VADAGVQAQPPGQRRSEGRGPPEHAVARGQNRDERGMPEHAKGKAKGHDDNEGRGHGRDKD
jgi:hypothetical protein